jgi:hypothetical protein
MSIIKEPTNKSPLFNLQVGPSWSSFEKFRIDGPTGLNSIKDHTVGVLHTKAGQYRILAESDFQEMLGLARDVDRLRGGMRVVIQAVRVVKKNPDVDNLNLLAETITLLGNLTELPTRNNFDFDLASEDEDFEMDPDDEVTLDSSKIVRPFSSESPASATE